MIRQVLYDKQNSQYSYNSWRYSYGSFLYNIYLWYFIHYEIGLMCGILNPPPLGIILKSRLILHTSFKYHISGCTICVNSLCNIIFFCWIYWKCIPVILLKLVYYCTIKRHWYTSPKHLSEAFFREKLNLTVLWCNFFDGFFFKPPRSLYYSDKTSYSYFTK